MTCRSGALLAAAAVCAGLFLQGCGGVPSFVALACEAQLEPTLGQVSLDGLDKVRYKCSTQYKSYHQQNLCGAQALSVVELSKQRVIPKYVKQCADYVVSSVCVSGATCYKKPDKITVTQADRAMDKYLQYNSASIMAAMAKDLGSKIDEVITKKYNTQFATRALPLVIQHQCEGILQQKMGNLDPSGQSNVMFLPNTELTRRCSGTKRSAKWVQTCQDKTVAKLYTTKEAKEKEFKLACAKSALAQECPIGSKCAIDTSLLNLQNTKAFGKTYVFLHYDQWFIELKAALMKDATEATGRLLAQPPTTRLFGVVELPTEHMKTGLLVWAGVGSLVAGAGLLVVAMAAVRATRKRFTRSVSLQPEISEEELLVSA